MIDNAKKIYLTIKDFSVSKESFDLYWDENYDMLITYPKPSPNDLQRYYESEDYISHSDKKSGVFNMIYQFVRGFTLKNKLNITLGFKRYGSLGFYKRQQTFTNNFYSTTWTWS